MIIRTSQAARPIPLTAPPASKPAVRPTDVDHFEAPPPPAAAPIETTDLTTHLVDAVGLNSRRALTYAKMSKGRSLGLSTLMIASEAIAIPLAAWLDRKARPFNAAGIPIMTGDFHSMEHVRPADAPPRYRGTASKACLRAVRSELRALRSQAKAASKAGDYQGVAGLARDAIRFVERTEQEAGAHFAMTRHVLESLGLCALNGAAYQRASGGETRALTSTVLSAHLFVLRATVLIDRLAQRRHAQGIGAIVNDVPPIPFEAAYDRLDPGA